MTRTLEDTADERARLANMCLADCGLPEVVRAVQRPGLPKCLWTPWDSDMGWYDTKAIYLATMAVHGPLQPTACRACVDSAPRGALDCERIPVADALRGRTCSRHGGDQ